MCRAFLWGQFYFSSSTVVSHAFSAHARTVHVFDVRASMHIILTPYATLALNFVSVAPSIAELAHGEKSCTQSLTHSPNLFDVLGREPKLSLRNSLPTACQCCRPNDCWHLCVLLLLLSLICLLHFIVWLCRYLAHSFTFVDLFLNIWQAAEACQLKLRSIGTKPEHISEGKIITCCHYHHHPHHYHII